MKLCKEPGCEYFVFSRQVCLPHWRQQFGKSIKRSRIKKSVRNIVKISDTKKIQDDEYKKICDELDTEAKAQKAWLCFFCGEPLGVSCDHHHVAGKVGTSDNNIPLYVDKDGIILCHRKCHREYHDITIKKLLKALYYKALMKKIHYLCRAKYFNMKLKHDEYVKNL